MARFCKGAYQMKKIITKAICLDEETNAKIETMAAEEMRTFSNMSAFLIKKGIEALEREKQQQWKK